jgi:hypothetical protein
MMTRGLTNMSETLFSDLRVREPPGRESRLSWRTVALLVALYSGLILLVTYPVVRTFSSRFCGGRADPMQALWVMRWYKDCLMHGRSPLMCPQLQYPAGAPLGNFSPLHFQAALYLPLSLAISNDVLCYNLIWLFNLVFTGVGSFYLAWYVLRDRWCAGVAGMAVMLSAPVQLHAWGHIELITLGWIPFFLIAWLRYVDHPTWRRLLAAAALYILVTLSAAYFAILATVPAVLYLCWKTIGQNWHGAWRWWRARLPWLLCFGALTGACLAVILFCQIWSRFEGYSLSRSRGEFSFLSVPLWGYVVPSYLHPLTRLTTPAVTPYEQAGRVSIESCSYFGVATLVLIACAGLRRPVFKRAGYWWLALAGCAVLSFGYQAKIFGLRILLPGGWLYHGCSPFHLIRAPARFNLFAAICASVLAAAALQQLLNGLRSRLARTLLFAACCLALVGDLALAPVKSTTLPQMPSCYDWLRTHHPHSALVDIPQCSSDTCDDLNAAYTYWQSLHHMHTTGGYSGFANIIADNLMWHSSPFARPRMAQSDYLAEAEATSVDLVARTRLPDYAWLYLTTHHLDHLVVHRDPALIGAYLAGLQRLEGLLRPALVYEDELAAVYDPSLLTAPVHPTVLCTTGWGFRVNWQGERTRLAGPNGRIAVFNPHADQLLVFTWEGSAFRDGRRVRLRLGNRELASWQVARDRSCSYTTAPFQLPSGLGELLLESDSSSRPDRENPSAENDNHSYSLRVRAIQLSPWPGSPISDGRWPAGSPAR